MKSFDGRIMSMFITGRPFIRDGEAAFFQYQALDIVDQKVQEQNLQHSASLEAVASWQAPLPTTSTICSR
jgi:hypothetical protein